MLKKKLEQEKKNEQKLEQKNQRLSAAKEKKQAQKEVQRQLEIEARHQAEEAHTRALGQAMVSDSSASRPSITTLAHYCLKISKVISTNLKLLYNSYFNLFQLLI